MFKLTKIKLIKYSERSTCHESLFHMDKMVKEIIFELKEGN